MKETELIQLLNEMMHTSSSEKFMDGHPLETIAQVMEYVEWYKKDKKILIPHPQLGLIYRPQGGVNRATPWEKEGRELFLEVHSIIQKRNRNQRLDKLI